MVDLGKRMVDIKEALEEGAAGLEAKEQLLDELVELVESIDQAKGGQKLTVGSVTQLWREVPG